MRELRAPSLAAAYPRRLDSLDRAVRLALRTQAATLLLPRPVAADIATAWAAGRQDGVAAECAAVGKDRAATGAAWTEQSEELEAAGSRIAGLTAQVAAGVDAFGLAELARRDPPGWLTVLAAALATVAARPRLAALVEHRPTTVGPDEAPSG